MRKKRTVFCGDIAEVVDLKSGEIFKPKDSNSKIIIEECSEDKTIAFEGGKDFMKLYIDIISKLVKELTPTEITFMFSLVPFISYEDCVIRRGGHGNGEALNAKQISESLGMDYHKARRLITALEKKGVMGHHVTGSLYGDNGKKKVYTVNPYIFFKGNKINRAVYDYYSKSGWKDVVHEE